MSIGARSQSARTYLEDHFKSFEDSSLNELIKHGLHALRETLQQDKELNVLNTSIAVVGADLRFRIIEGNELKSFLATMDPKQLRGATQPSAPSAADAPAGEGPTTQGPTPGGNADLMDTSGE